METDETEKIENPYLLNRIKNPQLIPPPPHTPQHSLP